MTAPHSPKRRRLAAAGSSASRDGPAKPGGSSSLDEESQQGDVIGDMDRRLRAYVSSCWTTDNAKGAAEHGNVCKVKIKSMGRAGRGLVLTQDVSPGELILYLSPSSLLHPGRLKAILPRELIPSKAVPSNSRRAGSEDLGGLPLPTPALLSLVLAIYAVQERESASLLPPGLEPLRSFVDSLPRDLSTIPLVWSRHSKSAENLSRVFTALCEKLPVHSKQMLAEVEERYEKDLHQARTVFGEHRERISQTLQASSLEDWSEDHFLWGWLCVNSRCLFLPLDLEPHSDNFTLAPLLDMANHSTDPAVEFKPTWTVKGGLRVHAPSHGVAQRLARSKEDQGQDDSSKHPWRGLAEGDEVTITYGPHSNATLLQEYGFTLFDAESGVMNKWSDYVLDSAIKSRISKIDVEESSSLHPASLLREAAYWEDWTLQAHPEAPHPSYRTVMALRLLAIWSMSEDEESLIRSNVTRWQKIVKGLVPEMSRPVEMAAVMLLLEIIEEELARAKRENVGVALAEDSIREERLEEGQRALLNECLRLVKGLWKEEIDILEGTLRETRKAMREGSPCW